MALNVTTAVFGENCNTATASPSLAQWDTEQVLQISGIDLPDSYKVEFSTVYTRNAIPAIGDASGVTIPNVLLQRSAPITAYVVLYGENGGRNREYWITIHITPGQPPETITPDPEQADVIDQAIAALNNGVARTEAAAEAAEGSASDAADHAADAEAWAVGQRSGVDVPDTDPTYHNNAKYFAGRAEAAAEEAGQHEASWESWARRAETAADDAEGSARAAAGSKADAETAAQTATQKATEAGNSAAAAAGSASEARQTVDGAIGAINTARDGALTQIGSAGSNATAAVNQAGTTQTERVTTEGNTQVNRVQAKGDEVIGSIPQDYTDLVDDVADLSRQLSDLTDTVSTTQIINTASGAIASFDDGADGQPIRKLVAQIEPVQDLHGYDSPWPAGGGVNKFDKDHGVNSTFTSSIATALSNFKSTGQYAVGYPSGNGEALSNNAQYCAAFTPCTPGVTYTIKNLMSGGNFSLICFLDDSGTTVSHNTNWSNEGWTHAADSTEKWIMLGVKVAELENVMIVEGSTMPSTPSPYSNICPISGHTGAEVTQTGINIADISMSQTHSAGLTVVMTPTTLSGLKATEYAITGENSSWGWRVVGNNIRNRLKPDTDYCLSLLTNGEVLSLANIAYGSGANQLNIRNMSAVTSVTSEGYIRHDFIFKTKPATDPVWETAPSQVLLLYSQNAMSGVNTTFIITTPQLSLGTTPPDELKDYAGETYDIAFPSSAGTVYGGTLDVTNGVLTVDRKSVTYDGSSDEAWHLHSAGSICFYINANDLIKLIDYRRNLIADKLKVSINHSFVQEYSVSGYYDFNSIYPAQNWIYLQHTTETTSAEIRSWLHDNPVTVVYTLANPITYQLTPQQLDTLLGTNNIWASTGDTSVEYCADTKLYVDNKITQAIANALNS